MPQAIDVAQTWAEYKQSNDQGLRDDLILHYLPIVKDVAWTVASGLARHVEVDDLESYGVFGLIDAIEKFDPTLGKFEPYARRRVKGKIVDELRVVDPIPRLIRSRSKAIDHASSKLAAELHRTPTEDELATELGWTLERLDQALHQAASAPFLPLDAVRDDGSALVDELAHTDLGPADGWELTEKRERLAEAVSLLPERERVILSLYYVQGLSFDKIAPVLGVGPPRLVTIHDKAIARVRTAIASGAV